MNKLILLLTGLLLSTQLLAWYPITPRPLRKLVIESENIIWGKVIETGSLKPQKREDDWERDFAIIEIQEVLQGVLKTKTVKVYFASGLICPAPGTFDKDETVLAFIDKKEKSDGYSVHALSYGVRHGLSPSGYQLIKTRVKEMQDILKMGDKEELDAAVLDWLVTCSEYKVTRWDGVYELLPESDFMSYYDRDGDANRKDIYLSGDQRKRIFNTVIRLDTLEYDELGLVDMATGIDDAALLSVLKKGLLLTDTVYLWEADGIMRRIVRLTQHKELDDIYSRFKKLDAFNNDVKAEKLELYYLFISKMSDSFYKKPIRASDSVSG